MHSIIRTYSGHLGLAEELKKHSQAIEMEIGTVPGFIAYTVIHTADGAVTVTMCENAKGCEESSRRAAEWLRRNLPALMISAPTVASGKVAFHFSKAPALV